MNLDIIVKGEECKEGNEGVRIGSEAASSIRD